jgi:hypothetical protein
MDDYQVVHWRLRGEIHEAVKAFAEDTHRSNNGAAAHLIERGLQVELAEQQARDAKGGKR